LWLLADQFPDFPASMAFASLFEFGEKIAEALDAP
jgi:hypothetical protein